MCSWATQHEVTITETVPIVCRKQINGFSTIYKQNSTQREEPIRSSISIGISILFQAHSRVFLGSLFLSRRDQRHFQLWHITTSLGWSPFVLQSHFQFISAWQMLLSLLQHSILNNLVNICWIGLHLSSNYGIRSNVPIDKAKTQRQRGQRRWILQHCCLNNLEMQMSHVHDSNTHPTGHHRVLHSLSVAFAGDEGLNPTSLVPLQTHSSLQTEESAPFATTNFFRDHPIVTRRKFSTNGFI